MERRRLDMSRPDLTHLIPANNFIPGVHPWGQPSRTTGMRIDRLFAGPRNASRPFGVSATAAFLVGGLLIIWSSYIHFHLWQEVGYRHIPTIGPLFILQSVAGLAIGVLVIATRRVLGSRDRCRLCRVDPGRVPHLGGARAFRI